MMMAVFTKSLKKLEWFVEPCKVRGELLFAFSFRSLLKPVASFYGFREELYGFSNLLTRTSSGVHRIGRLLFSHLLMQTS